MENIAKNPTTSAQTLHGSPLQATSTRNLTMKSTGVFKYLGTQRNLTDLFAAFYKEATESSVTPPPRGCKILWNSNANTKRPLYPPITPLFSFSKPSNKAELKSNWEKNQEEILKSLNTLLHLSFNKDIELSLVVEG